MDRILTNAVVHTLDQQSPRATTIAIRGDRIVATGGGEVRSLAERHTVVEDMKGATIIPGLTDAHIHWEKTAVSLSRINLMDVPTKEEAVRRVAEVAAKAKPGEWLEGFGWAQGTWPGGAFPTAADLDPVTPHNPVYLSARSGHATWVNSLALKEAGITASTPNPKGGEIQRDRKGEATGLLLEDGNIVVARVIPTMKAEDVAAAMETARELAWRCGLTGLHDYDWELAFEAMQLLHERGALGLRVLKHINLPFIHHAHELRLRTGFGDDWLRLGALKIFADGALGPLTAQMVDPYEGQPNNRGMIVTPKAEMLEAVMRASRHGFPSTIHAIGDEAVRHVLDVYEEVRRDEARRGVPPSAMRHRIEHVQIVHPDDVRRLAELQVIGSFQPIHATSDYPVADQYWGARSRLAYNARVQIDQGVHVAFGSDSPVEPFEPFKGIHAAVTRRRADGSPGREGWYPEARITIDEAIRGYTEGPAWAAYMEDRLGRLAPNFLADLIVLDRDPYAIDPDDLLKVGVMKTMVGGEWKFSGD
ncbi:amidohydrolase [Candidatus Sumerlaeota bacterium]|nr:amidohydrolase [Candidatus Sumerlaeota bacterium]